MIAIIDWKNYELEKSLEHIVVIVISQRLISRFSKKLVPYLLTDQMSD